MARLSKELFEADPNSYGAEALEILAESGSGLLPIPQAAKTAGLRTLQWRYQHLPKSRKIVERHVDCFAEAFGASFRFASSETWEDLDSAHAASLITSTLEGLHEAAIGVVATLDQKEREYQLPGWDQIAWIGRRRANPDFRLFVLTVWLDRDDGSDGGLYELRDYLSSRAAYARLESLDQEHLRLGVLTSDVRSRHVKAFEEVWIRAWDVGRWLGLLHVLGEVPEDRPTRKRSRRPREQPDDALTDSSGLSA